MPLAQHVPLHVVPRQLHPSSGFPLQFTQGPKQWFTQMPLSHVGEEKHVEHFVAQPPQWLTSVMRSTQPLPQFVWPCGHPHTPATQDSPAAQLCPQVPQLLELLWRSTQLPLQLVSPAGH